MEYMNSPPPPPPPPPPTSQGDSVWIIDEKAEGIVNKEIAERSYQIETPKGTVRRNRKHLVALPDTKEEQTSPSSNKESTDTIEPVGPVEKIQVTT